MRKKRLCSKSLYIWQCAIISLMLFMLVSCDGPGNNLSTGQGGTTGKDPANIHVSFISQTSGLDFALEMAAGAQYAADQYHVSAQIVAPPIVDFQAELKLFNQLTQTSRDGIAVETLAPDLFTRVEAGAAQQGIPLIAVDTVPLPGSKIASYVGNDNISAGGMLADAAIKLIPTNVQGNFLIGEETIGASVLDYRAQGMKMEFQRLRPALQLVGPFHSQEDKQLNLAAWADAIAKHSPVVACLGVGDNDNTSLAQLKQDKHGTYLSGAFDLDPTALEAIANGTNFALVDPEHFLKGYVAMRLLIEHALYGNPIPQGWWNPGALLVTQRNVQQIIKRQTNLDSKGHFYQPIIDQEFANPAAQIKPLDQAK